LDEEFLKLVANTSGCGSYNNAQTASQLANTYVELRHTSTGGTVLLQQVGQIAQGQTVNIGTANVPGNQSLILFTINWPGSSLAPILVDPKGKKVNASYPNATISSSATLATIIVNNPRSGQWNVSAQGVAVPEGITTYNAILSTRAGAIVTPRPSGGLAVVVIILVLVGGGTAIYAMNPKKRRKKPAPLQPVGGPAFQLLGLSGSIAGQVIPLLDGFTIGRSAACHLRLIDPTVSRQHARLRFANGQWFIQDLKSAGGTQVNGQRVQAARLKPGDQITIGSSTFEFKET
jgi:hypothetical protein